MLRKVPSILLLHGCCYLSSAGAFAVIDSSSTTRLSRRQPSAAAASPRRRRQREGGEEQQQQAVVVSLQDPHPRESPATVLRRLADLCDDDEQGIDAWDVYGDFDLAKQWTPSTQQPQQQSPPANGHDEATTTTELNGFTASQHRKDNGVNEEDIVDGADDTTLPPISSQQQQPAAVDEQSSSSSSFLRRFEAEVAADLGKEDAVFMPSGVMAQSIALLIHRQQKQSNAAAAAADHFICHETSHLLLHEREGYDKLLHMKPLVVTTPFVVNDDEDDDNGNVVLGAPAMGFSHILQTLTERKWSESVLTERVAAVLVELPHRELGGKVTSREDLTRLREWCNARKVAMHCDGARLFEATAAYDDDETTTPAQLAAPFDSVYVSFYKGLGGMAGAMLCGSNAFCDEARMWLRRFGGNLYTVLPYAVAARDGYRRNWKDLLPATTSMGDEDQSPNGDANAERDDNDVYRHSFSELRDKLRALVSQLSDPDGIIAQLVTFDPAVPVTNMVHGYLRCTADEGLEWCRWITAETGVQVLRRIQPLPDQHPARAAGFQSKFEWTLGQANGQVLNEVFTEGWTALAETYLANQRAVENGENPIEYNADDVDDEDEKTVTAIAKNDIKKETDDEEVFVPEIPQVKAEVRE